MGLVGRRFEREGGLDVSAFVCWDGDLSTEAACAYGTDFE